MRIIWNGKSITIIDGKTPYTAIRFSGNIKELCIALKTLSKEHPGWRLSDLCNLR